MVPGPVPLIRIRCGPCTWFCVCNFIGVVLVKVLVVDNAEQSSRGTNSECKSPCN